MQQLLDAEAVWGEVVTEFAKGNYRLTDTDLHEEAKYLVGL